MNYNRHIIDDSKRLTVATMAGGSFHNGIRPLMPMLTLTSGNKGLNGPWRIDNTHKPLCDNKSFPSNQ